MRPLRTIALLCALGAACGNVSSSDGSGGAGGTGSTAGAGSGPAGGTGVGGRPGSGGTGSQSGGAGGGASCPLGFHQVASQAGPVLCIQDGTGGAAGSAVHTGGTTGTGNTGGTPTGNSTGTGNVGPWTGGNTGTGNVSYGTCMPSCPVGVGCICGPSIACHCDTAGTGGEGGSFTGTGNTTGTGNAAGAGNVSGEGGACGGANLASDASNCGVCGHACAAGQSCNSGTCRGYGNCAARTDLLCSGLPCRTSVPAGSPTCTINPTGIGYSTDGITCSCGFANGSDVVPCQPGTTCGNPPTVKPYPITDGDGTCASSCAPGLTCKNTFCVGSWSCKLIAKVTCGKTDPATGLSVKCGQGEVCEVNASDGSGTLGGPSHPCSCYFIDQTNTVYNCQPGDSCGD